MKETGLSRRELARRSGVSAAEIDQIVWGTRNPKDETLEKLARHLRVSSQELRDAKDADRGITRRQFLELTGITVAGIAVTLDRVPQSIYDQILKAGRARATGVMTMEAYEDLAEAVHAEGNWAGEELLWLLASQSAAQRGDWQKWANAMLRTGQTALNLSKFDIAKIRFTTVLKQHEVSTDAKVEARARLAWVYFEEEKYHDAHVLLSQVEGEVKELLRDREGDPYLDALREMVYHFKGRTLAALHELENNEGFLKEALHYLNLAYKLDEKYQSAQTMGFDLLRQVPIFSDQGRMHEANYSLDRAEELLGEQGTAQGHINYHKALLSRDGALKKRVGQSLPKPEDLLERAAEGFMDPIFYPRGLAHVYYERSTLTVESDLEDSSTSLDRLKQAFQYGFTGSILQPYAENLGHIGTIARAVYSHLGRSREGFLGFTRELTEKVINMNQEPFAALKLYDPSVRTWVVQGALVKIEAEIKGAVDWSSKESLFSPITDNLLDLIPIELV